jgi:hypothetical protein
MMKSNISCPLLPTGAHHDTHDEEQYYLSTSSYRSPSWYTWWRGISTVYFFLQEPIMMKSNITCPLLPIGAHHDEEQYYLSTSSYRSPSWWRAILPVHFFLQEPIMIHMMKSNIPCPLCGQLILLFNMMGSCRKKWTANIALHHDGLL